MSETDTCNIGWTPMNKFTPCGDNVSAPWSLSSFDVVRVEQAEDGAKRLTIIEKFNKVSIELDSRAAAYIANLLTAESA